MVESVTSSEYFDELNLQELIRYAKRWAREYPFINRIVLYEYYSRHTPEIEDKFGEVPTIYAVVFEINDFDNDDPEFLNFLFITGYSKTIKDNLTYNRLIRKRFSSVYKDKPDKDYWREWRFIPKRPSDKFHAPAIIDDHPFVLYPIVESEEADNECEGVPEKESEHQYAIPEDCFIRKGNVWTISFHGKETQTSDTHRIRYIANLLNNPSKPIHVGDLHKMVAGVNPNEAAEEFKRTDEQLAEQGMSLSDFSETLSHDDEENHKKNIRGILNRIESASDLGNDSDRLIAEDDLVKYRRYLLDEFGIKLIVFNDEIRFEKMKRSGSDNDKIRKNVGAQIRGGLKKISSHLPELSEYLKSHLKLGLSCSYNPDKQNPVKWKIIL